MGQSSAISDHLRRLHDGYVFLVNCAIEEGRDDEVRRLADAYPDDALRVLTAVSRP